MRNYLTRRRKEAQMFSPFSGLALRLCGDSVTTQTAPVERRTGAAGSSDQPEGQEQL